MCAKILKRSGGPGSEGSNIRDLIGSWVHSFVWPRAPKDHGSRNCKLALGCYDLNLKLKSLLFDHVDLGSGHFVLQGPQLASEAPWSPKDPVDS